VLFLDLDNFKRINDTLGHDCGDRVLKTVADRLVKSVRQGDGLARVEEADPPPFVARLGGDEFTILLADLRTAQDVATIAQRLLDMIAEPLLIDTQEIFITASIGITIYHWTMRILRPC